MKPKLLILIVLSSSLMLAAAPQGGRKPLNKDQILALVKGSVPSARVVELVQQNGIDFAPTDDYLRSLRAVHAEQVLIDALRAAGSAKPPLPTGAEQAKQQIKAANALMDSGDIDGAIALYKQATQSNPGDSEAHRQLGIALGRKSDWQGDIAEQRAAILANPDDAAAKAELAAALHASTEAVTSDLVVESSPNAEVYLDDEFKGRTGAEGQLKMGDLKPGAHTLRVSLPQKKGFEQSINLVASQSQTIQAPLADLPGKIVIQTTAGAEAFLDNVSRGMADAGGGLIIQDVPLGSHELRISAMNKREHHESVAIAAGQDLRIEAPLVDAVGRIVVQTAPGARVAVNEENRGIADASGTLAVPDLVRGTYRLRVTAAGKKDFQQSVTVAAGEETRIDAPLADLPPTPGMVRENPIDGLKYAWVPPGNFMMGCSTGEPKCGPEERPLHSIRITKGFWMGQLEVPVSAYKRFVTDTQGTMPPDPVYNRGWNNENLPMVKTTWSEANAYCLWAGGRLPTEAAWEYAARAGSPQSIYGSMDEIAWYAGNTRVAWSDSGVPRAGGLKRPNAFGLFDTLGNVREWTGDWFDKDYYAHSPQDDPTGPSAGNDRVARGRAWLANGEDLRVSFRGTNSPDGRFYDVGFRCVCDALRP